MYLEHYGFDLPPFNLTPDSRFLFLSERHREALASLEYGITSRKGFTVLTGDIGAGKTTLCRSLLHRLSADTKVALILNSYLSDIEILQTINDELGVAASNSTSRKALIDALNRFLLLECAAGNDVLVIIDEAQNLAPATLEQIRMLSNLETENDKLLQILLMGQPELRDTLRLPQLEQLNQRITVRYHLGPLSEEETAAYLEHRMRVAGAAHRARFTPEAVKALYAFSKGVPRKTNLVADRTLLGGYSIGALEMTPELVRSAIEEVAGTDDPAPAPPEANAPRPAAAPQAASQPDLAPLPPAGQGVAAALAQASASYGPPMWPNAMPWMPPMMAAPMMMPPGYAPAAMPAPAPVAPVPAPASERHSHALGRVGTVLMALSAGLLVVLVFVAGIAGTIAIIRPDMLGDFSRALTPATSGTAAAASSATAMGAPGQPSASAIVGAASQPPRLVAATPTPRSIEPSPTPRPTPRPTPLPVTPWTVDARGIVRVTDPTHLRFAAELTLIRQQFGADIRTERLASLAPSTLASLSVVDLPDLRTRRLIHAELDVSFDDLLAMRTPAVLRVRPPENATLSPTLVLLSPEVRDGHVTLGDPRHGLLRLPLALAQRVFLRADVFFFDEENLLSAQAGQSSPEARRLQDLLVQAGVWREGTEPDGRFGLTTRQAIITLQDRERLDPTGNLDEPTLFRLLHLTGRLNASPQPASTPADATQTTPATNGEETPDE